LAGTPQPGRAAVNRHPDCLRLPPQRGEGGSIRADGRVRRDVHLMRVKPPAASRREWDVLAVAETTGAADAHRPLVRT